MPTPTNYQVPRERGEIGRMPIAANVQFGQNELVFRNAQGEAVPWSADAALVPLGVARAPFDNAGGPAKAFELEYLEAGTFGLKIHADDPVSTAEVSTLVYAASPNAVAKTSDGDTRPPLGKLRGVYEGRAWIRFI